MARIIKNRRCIVCGVLGVQLWTLDNMQNAAVTYLCPDHGAPLLAIMEMAGFELAPDDQIPMPMRSPEPEEPPARGRLVSMKPIMDWTPPD